MDLESVLNATIQETLKSGIIQQTIKQAVERAVTITVRECVERNLTSYSAFGKQVEEVVKKSLQLHGSIDLPSYNDMILKIIAAQVEHATNESIEKQVAERMKELLSPAPESITLTDLVIEFINHAKREYESGCVCTGGNAKKISLCVKDEGSSSSFFSIGLDREGEKTINQCDIYFGCNRKGEIYHLRFRNEEVERRMFVGPLYGFERMLFQMKAAKTKIVIDQDPEDIEMDYWLENEE